MPKVSVIIPVYGVEQYIERCARRLFEQTLDDIEYLFIDDRTPDKSIEVLNRVLEDYPERKQQVVIYRMENNSGQAKVREWGINNSTGEYVIHCDSDDWVDPDMYRTMYEKAKEDNADVVVCDYKLVDCEKVLKVVKGCGSTDCKQFLIRQLFKKDSWALWNKLFSRRIFNDLQYPHGNMGEDMVLCIQMMLRCQKVSYTSGLYYYYFYNNTSISNRRDVSHHLHNFQQVKENTDMLIRILQDINIPHKTWVVNALQYNATTALLNIIHSNKKYKDIWKNAYSGAIFKYAFNPYIKFEMRIKCILAILGFYPLKRSRIVQ